MRIIHPSDFMHETDAQTLEQLKSIPGFSALLKAFMQVWNEQLEHVLNMSGKILLGPDQLPEIYDLLPPIAESFGIEVPQLFLQWSAQPNAYTYGDTKPYINITTTLINTAPRDVLTAILAHECAHIACSHVLYHSMGRLLLNNIIEFPGLDLLSLPLKMALLAWQRASEFSCDRAAALYMGGDDEMIRAMMLLAGGVPNTQSKLNMDAYIRQAEAYYELSDESNLNKMMKFLVTVSEDHPLLAVRAHEIKKWCAGEDFQSILRRSEVQEALPGSGVCPGCGGATQADWLFCKACGQKLQ